MHRQSTRRAAGHAAGRSEPARLTPTQQALAWGGVVGPAAFVAAWVTAGALDGDRSPIDDAISRLAEVGAPTTGRVLVTGGLVAFGVGVPLYARALRAALPGRSWVAATVAGLGSLGVAATPLEAGVDDLHGLAAGVAYLSLAATPLLAAAPLERAGRGRAARRSRALAVVALVSLVVSNGIDTDGLFQRLGFTLLDGWIIWSALDLARRGTLTATR